jgi:hypothetical protein
VTVVMARLSMKAMPQCQRTLDFSSASNGKKKSLSPSMSAGMLLSVYMMLHPHCRQLAVL